ncbi:unnamed protein product [Amoebophrya sp. A25]|nr:unnamed protein product [Amoebophrya sp. A25]|eukprot:GSA25T00009760001.1
MKPKAGVLPKRTSIGGSVRGAHAAPRTAPDSNAGTPRTRTAPRSSRGIVLPNRPSERGRVPKNGKVNRTGGANVLDRDAFERRQKDRSSGADVLDRDSLARLLMDSQKDGNAGNLHNNSMRREVDRAMSTDVLDAEGIARLLKNARENVDDGEQGLDSGGAGVPRTSAAQDVAIASRANDRMSEADSLNETSLRRLLDQDNTSSAKGLLDALSMARFHERDQRSTLKPRRPSLSNKLDEALRDGDEDARAGDSEVVLQEQVQQEEHGIGRDESDEPYLRPMGPKRTPTAARTRRKEIRKATPSARPGVEKDKEDEPWTDEELDREVVAYEFGGKRVTNVVELFQVLRPKQPQLDYSALAEGPLFGRFAAYFMPVSTPSKVFNFVVLNAPAYLRPVTRKKIRQRRILREEKKREEQRRLETMRAKSPDASLEQDELDSVLSSDTERARNHADLPPRLQIFSRGQSKEGEALSVDAFISADEDVPDDLSNKKSIVKLLDHAKAKVGSFRPAYSGEDVRQRDMLRRDAYLRQFLEAGGTPDRPLFDTRPVNINKVMLRRCGVTQPEDDEEYSETDEHGLHPKRLRRILMERYLQDVESRTKKRASIALLNREELVSMNKATSNPEFWENWRARQDAVSPTATFRGLVEQYSPLTVPGATGRSPPTSAALFRLRSKIEGSSSARVGQFLNSAPSGGVSAYDEMQRSTKGEQVQRHRLCGHLAGLFEAAPPAQLDADINAQSDSFQHSAWPLEEQAQVLQRGHLEQLKQLALREEKDRVTHAINVAAAGVKSTVMKGMAKEAGVGEDALPETASSLKNNGGANTSATASAIGPTASSPTATEGAIGQSSKWNPIATFNMHLRGSESQEFAGRPGTAWGVSCICEHPILADTVIAGTTTGGWKILHWNEEEVEEDEDTYDDADISAFVGEGMNSSGKSAKGSGWFSWLFYGEREEGGNNAMNNQIDPSLKLSAPFLGESMIFPSTHMDGQSGSLKGDGQSSLHLESFRRWGSFLRYREKQAELKQLTASRGAGFQAAVADPGPSKIGEQLKCPDAHPGGHMVTDLTMHRRCRRLLTVGSDHYYRVWDLEEPDLLPLVQSYANPVRTNSVAAHDFSDFVAAGDSDHVVRIWDLNRGFCAYAPAQVMRGHIASVRHVEFEPFGNGVLTASKDGSAAVFDLRSGLCVQLWDGLRYSVISPHDKKARFANGAGGAAKGVGYSGGPLNSAHFSPDLTSVLTVGEYGVCRLYDRRQTRRELFRFASKSGVAKRACFDSTGKTIAICCPQSVFLLDVDKQEYLHGITPRSELRSSADSVPLFTSALFTRENRNLAVASLNCGLTIFEKEAR